MKPLNLDIYREYYGETCLRDIWDKITDVLEEHGTQQAEQVGLQLTEWIRTTWGGVLLTERHVGDPANYSRFDLLRDQVLEILGNPALAAEIVRIVRTDYLGKYIVKIKKLALLQRDADIFNRANTPAQMEQLALENDISVIRAYQINARMLKSKNKREQPLLPFG